MNLRHWLSNFCVARSTIISRRSGGRRRTASGVWSRQVEFLESRAMLTPRFAGSYAGTFIGSFNDNGDVEAIPGATVSDNSIEVTIVGSTVNVSVPGIDGTGTGTIGIEGEFDGTAMGSVESSSVGVRYQGSLNQSANGIEGSGSWTITSGPEGVTGSGTWSLRRQTATDFDGNYAGSFTGAVNGNAVPGPFTVTDNSIDVLIADGLVYVEVPGIDGEGKTTIFPSGGEFSVTANGMVDGDVGGELVRIEYSGTLTDNGGGSVTGSGNWQVVNSSGFSGNGTWQLSRLAASTATVNLTDGTAMVRFDENSNSIVIEDGSGILFQQSYFAQTEIVINGTSGDDTLTIDFDEDFPPIPAGGITFNGGSQGASGDTLHLTNGSNIAIVNHRFADGSSGSVSGTAEVGFLINYTGLEPIVDELGSEARTFTFSGADDDITVEDIGASNDGVMRISTASGTSESVDFIMTGEDLAVFAGAGDDQITIASLDASFIDEISLGGGDGRDRITGSNRADFIDGGSGFDTLLGGPGNDSISGGAGNDTVFAGPGSDRVSGNAGNDRLFGESGFDTLSGGDGNDFLRGSSGNDRLEGGADDDQIFGDDNNDTAIGGSGDDVINGGDGSDVAFGDDGNDMIDGGSGDDRLFGGTGNDGLQGAAGRDFLRGGDGDDDLGAGGGFDTLFGDGGNDTLAGDDGNDTAFGGTGRDSIFGNSGNDRLFGESGFDTLSGGTGNDFIRGSRGNDRLIGNAGNDVIIGDENNDTAVGGSGDDSIRGDAGADVVFGEDGNDTIDGGSGNDRLFGGNGSDTVLGGNGGDFVRGGDDDDFIEGNRGFDTLFGDNGDDFVSGGDGNDTLFGSNGLDELMGDSGNDRIFGSNGFDTLSGGIGDDFLRGGSGNDLISGDDGNDELIGDDHNDTLSGGENDDMITGNNGSDFADGGSGADIIDVQEGALPDGIDTVSGVEMIDTVFSDANDVLT